MGPGDHLGMKTSFAPTRGLGRTLGACLALGVFLGAASVSPEAQALSCASSIGETLDLELSAVEIGGEALELDAAAAADLRWPVNIHGNDNGFYLAADDEGLRGEYFELDMEIAPTDEVADYISTSAARESRGFVCSGVPYAALVPGVYLISASEFDTDLEAWPEGTTLTLDAERGAATVEFEGPDGLVSAHYEVVDFYFHGDEGGCSVTGERTPAPLGLALLALVAWRRKARRGDEPSARS